jgi:hypothetical protein
LLQSFGCILHPIAALLKLLPRFLLLLLLPLRLRLILTVLKAAD